MTYNIFMGGRRGRALHEVVAASSPDILLVNESPKRFLFWKRECRRLTGAWGMRFVTGGRPAGSNMIAVAPGVAVKASGSEVLSQPLFQPRRGIAWAQLRVGGRLVGVVSCHLSLDRERRAKEVERVIAVARRLRGPVVVGGDLNEPPDGPSWQRLRQAGFVDHGSKKWQTFPADQPEKRIDALLVRGDVTVVAHGDPGVRDELLAAGSDHRPVLAVLDAT
jgi:endonuclease/exonuclease/phosphatase family metal-dependent hydrolase